MNHLARAIVFGMFVSLSSSWAIAQDQVQRYSPDDYKTQSLLYRIQTGHAGFFGECDQDRQKLHSPYITWGCRTHKKCNPIADFWNDIYRKRNRLAQGAGDCVAGTKCRECQAGRQCANGQAGRQCADGQAGGQCTDSSCDSNGTYSLEQQITSPNEVYGHSSQRVEKSHRGIDGLFRKQSADLPTNATTVIPPSVSKLLNEPRAGKRTEELSNAIREANMQDTAPKKRKTLKDFLRF